MATAVVVNPWKAPTKASVYNPWPKRLESSFGAMNYIFPPGVSEFVSKTAHYEPRGKRQRMIPVGKEPLEVCLNWFFGFQVVETKEGYRTVQGDGQLGPEGLRVLTGDSEEDSRIKADGDSTYQAKRRGNAANTVTAHEQSVQRALDQRVAPPAPSKEVLEAQEFLSKAGGYLCAMPGFGCYARFEAKQDLDDHVSRVHGDKAMGFQSFRQGVVQAQQLAAVAVPSPEIVALLETSQKQVAALTDLVAKLAAGKIEPAVLPKGVKRKPGRPKLARPISDEEEAPA